MRRIQTTLFVLFLFLPMLHAVETFQEIADQAAPGVLGIAVQDLRGGPIQGVNLRRPFPMQSVFKAFLSAAILAQVDDGQLSLNRMITLAPTDLRDGYGSIDHSAGGDFSVRDLLRTALIESDNSAADALLRLAGGPPVLTAWLRSRGIDGVRIDRDERTIARDENGVPAHLSPDQNASSLRSRVSKATRHAAFELALSDPRDTATPEGTIHFLIALKKGNLLSPASTELLLEWLREVRTGQGRLKAGFSPQAILAHKTGTSGIFEGVSLATNDIGLAQFPDGRVLAIAVFLANSPASEEAREGLLAACARIASRSN